MTGSIRHPGLALSAFTRRLIYTLTTTATNIVPSLIGAKLLPRSGHSITAFLTCSILASSLAVMQWERENQHGDLNSAAFDAILLTEVIFAFIILCIALSIQISVESVALVLASLWLTSNIQVFSCRCAFSGSPALLVGTSMARAAAATTLFFCCYNARGMSFLQYLWINFATLLIAFVILAVLGRPKKKLNHPPVDRVALLIIGIDFIRGQAWMLLSGGFTATLTLPVIYLIRQAIGPIAILLATRRASVFDAAIRNDGDQVTLHKGARKIYASLAACAALAVTLAAALRGTIGYVFYVTAGWLLLVLAQDFRGYINRIATINIGGAIWLLFFATIPTLLLTLVNIYIIRVDVTHLIMATFAGEMLAIIFLRNYEPPINCKADRH